MLGAVSGEPSAPGAAPRAPFSAAAGCRLAGSLAAIAHVALLLPARLVSRSFALRRAPAAKGARSTCSDAANGHSLQSPGPAAGHLHGARLAGAEEGFRLGGGSARSRAVPLAHPQGFLVWQLAGDRQLSTWAWVWANTTWQLMCEMRGTCVAHRPCSGGYSAAVVVGPGLLCHQGHSLLEWAQMRFAGFEVGCSCQRAALTTRSVHY